MPYPMQRTRKAVRGQMKNMAYFLERLRKTEGYYRFVTPSTQTAIWKALEAIKADNRIPVGRLDNHVVGGPAKLKMGTATEGDY